MPTLVPIEDDSERKLVPVDEPALSPGWGGSGLPGVGPIVGGAKLAREFWKDPAAGVQTADDAVRAAANAVSFGLADRLAGYMGGQGTTAEVARSEEARKRSPAASLAGDVAGAAMVPGLGAEAMAARLGGGALARAGAYGATGGLTGAAQGAGNTYTEEPGDYVRNAILGGGAGAALGGIGGAAFGARPARPPAAATIPEQRAVENLAYEAFRRNPTRYDAGHFAQRANDVEHSFYTNPRFVTEREFSPTSFRVLDRMRAPAAAAAQIPGATADVTPSQIDLTRRILNKIPQGTPEHATDRASARSVRRAIDDFIENPPQGAVLPGNADAARSAIAQAILARQSHAGAERSQIFENIRRKAESEAGSRNSGLNTEAKMRTALSDLTKPRTKAYRGQSVAQQEGFNPAEITGMERFAAGTDTPLRNTIRYLGNLGGGGGGLGALAAGGVGVGAGATYASDDPRWLLAIGAPAAGLGFRMAGNRIARQNIGALDEMIRMRTPASQYIQQTQPMRPGGGSATAAKLARDALTLELLKSTGGQ